MVGEERRRIRGGQLEKNLEERCWGSIAESYQTLTGRVNDTQQVKENGTENDVNNCQSNLSLLRVPVRVYL
jgi:hypothetical protein